MSGRVSPSLSIILPVKDGMPYLVEALDGLWGQTFRGFEVLVIDDGSRDATSDYLRSVTDPRLRVVRNETSRGIGGSLNQGVALATTALIGRQDSDDVSLPQRLELQVEFMASHPECLVVGTQAQMIDATGNDLGPYLTPPTDELARKEQVLQESPFVHGSVLMRREHVVALGGYRPRVGRAEDFDLWLRMAERGRLANLPDVLYQYRIHGSQSLASVTADSDGGFWLCKFLDWERKCMGDEDSLSVLSDAQIAAIKRGRMWRPRGSWRRRVRVLWNFARRLESQKSPRRAALTRLLAVTGGW